MALDLETHGLGAHPNLGGYELMGPSPDSDSTLLPLLGKWAVGQCLLQETEVSP